jgi:GNAT superfamily N-acetyltransferase
MSASIAIRQAGPADAGAILGLIRELADFERLTHLLVATPADLANALGGARPAAECLLAEHDGRAVGYALYFHNYSTFLGRRGLYLEDLYVSPAHRRDGIGTRLLQRLASLAVARGCERFEWTVLDWNTEAIAFYERLGAQVLPGWRVVRMTGEALRAMGRAATDRAR